VPFLELAIYCHVAQQPRYEQALEEIGALALTLLDADADADADAENGNERAILEPGLGQTPLWDEITLSALFPGDADALRVLVALSAFDPVLDWSRARLRAVGDQDWERAWMDQYAPLAFGMRTFIVPWNQALPAQAVLRQVHDERGIAVVRLDPGLAFGSGTHPTTALCLQWLDALAAEGVLQDARVLDFGCGSGILALAALKLGAAHAVGVDNDPQALLATHDNAERNRVADRLAVYLPSDEPPATYRVVVANILAYALDALADTLAARMVPGGRIALSGILDGQQAALIERYATWFERLEVVHKGDWVRIDGLRRLG